MYYIYIHIIVYIHMYILHSLLFFLILNSSKLTAELACCYLLLYLYRVFPQSSTAHANCFSLVLALCLLVCCFVHLFVFALANYLRN